MHKALMQEQKNNRLKISKGEGKIQHWELLELRNTI